MSSSISLHFDVSGDDFTRAGEASTQVKKTLKKIGYDSDAIRRVAIAMYEGEINMVIHAGGGTADVEIYPDRVDIVLTDEGPGIEDVEKAMTAGFSTAPDNVRSLGFGAGMGLPNIEKYTDSMRIETEIGVGTKMFLSVNAGGSNS
ncbi:MAG: ATP-binding protein [Oscillospiraceae bacterium]|nr:ATP-binding protein [Oscillospiraceae bacterium]